MKTVFFKGKHFIKELDILFAGTVLYLFIPAILFFFGWLHLWLALPLTAITLYGLYLTLKSRAVDTNKERTSPTTTPWNIRVVYLCTLVLCFLLVFWSGVAGHTDDIGVADPQKQHMTLRELIRYSWPPAFQSESLFGTPEVQAPAYHIFYYLTPAAIGKIAGWTFANYFLTLWVTLGLFMAACWLYRLIEHRNPLFLLLFVFFGGLDITATLFFNTNGIFSPCSFPDAWWSQASNDIEAMKGLMIHYPSHYLLLSWLPNHAIPLWLTMGVTLHEILKKRSLKNIFFINSVLPAWSVFSAIGIFHYLGLAVVLEIKDRFFTNLLNLKKYSFYSLQNMVIGPLIVFILSLYINSTSSNFESRYIFSELNAIWPMLLFFYATEFFIYYLLIPNDALCSDTMKNLKRCMVVTLFAPPMYLMGVNNDFCGRVCMPSIYILSLCLMQTLLSGKISWLHRRLLLIILLAGTFPAINVLHTNLYRSSPGISVKPEADVISMFDYTEAHKADAVCGMGTPDSFFWKYLAKPVNVVREKFTGNTLSSTIGNPQEADGQWFCRGSQLHSHFEYNNQKNCDMLEFTTSARTHRLDLLENVEVSGEFHIRLSNGKWMQLKDAGMLHISLEDRQNCYYNGTFKQTSEGRWTHTIEKNSIPRSKSIKLVVKLELLRKGVHRINLKEVSIKCREVTIGHD